MLQLMAQMIPVVFTGLIAYLTYRISISIKNAGGWLLQDYGWIIEKTPALDAFLIFTVQAVLVSMAAACGFRQVSNHIILSLDILYFISLLMLILYHNLKEAGNLLVKEI